MGYIQRNVDRGRCRAAVRTALDAARTWDPTTHWTATPTFDTPSVSRREVYLRFAAGPRHPDSHQQKGIFHATKPLTHPGRLTDVEHGVLLDGRRWFNENLIAPDLDEPRAIFWFRSSASARLARIRERVALMRDNGIPVHMLRCSDPGLIVYRDELQVAAVPQRRVRWHRRTY